MPEILRVKYNWTGFVGAPGFTNLYFSEFNETGYTQEHADGAAAKAQTFLAGIQGFLPAAVTTQQDPIVDIIQSDTGDLVGFFNTTVAAAQPGLTAGPYSAASGACISWGTNGVRNGRRVRGRTFIVPLAATQYDATGSILDPNLALLRGHANDLIGAGGTSDFGVWSRPSAPDATDGVWYPAQTATVKDKVAILRSRRD